MAFVTLYQREGDSQAREVVVLVVMDVLEVLLEVEVLVDELVLVVLIEVEVVVRDVVREVEVVVRLVLVVLEVELEVLVVVREVEVVQDVEVEVVVPDEIVGPSDQVGLPVKLQSAPAVASLSITVPDSSKNLRLTISPVSSEAVKCRALLSFI